MCPSLHVLLLYPLSVSQFLCKEMLSPTLLAIAFLCKEMLGDSISSQRNVRRLLKIWGYPYQVDPNTPKPKKIHNVVVCCNQTCYRVRNRTYL